MRSKYKLSADSLLTALGPDAGDLQLGSRCGRRHWRGRQRQRAKQRRRLSGGGNRAARHVVAAAGWRRGETRDGRRCSSWGRQ